MLKNKLKVAINRNGGFALDYVNKLAQLSHGSKKLAIRRTKMSLKDRIRAGVVNKGQYHISRHVDSADDGNFHNSPYGESQFEKRCSATTSLEESSLSLQGRAITVLTDREWEQLMDALDNLKGPGPQLKKMCKKYA